MPQQAPRHPGITTASSRRMPAPAIPMNLALYRPALLQLLVVPFAWKW